MTPLTDCCDASYKGNNTVVIHTLPYSIKQYSYIPPSLWCTSLLPFLFCSNTRNLCCELLEKVPLLLLLNTVFPAQLCVRNKVCGDDILQMEQHIPFGLMQECTHVGLIIDKTSTLSLINPIDNDWSLLTACAEYCVNVQGRHLYVVYMYM